MTKEMKLFSTAFISMLGEFVKTQRKAGKNLGLNKDEINAVITKTFYLLSKAHKKFEEKAEIK